MKEEIGHFLNFLAVEKGAATNTIAAYKNDLQQFRAYISSLSTNGDRPFWGQVDRDALLDFILDLRRRRYADATVARKVAALKSFFSFLQAEGILRKNPAESINSPRVGKSLPRPLSVREIDELLEQPARRSSPEARRDRAMLEALYATGMRVTEMVSLDMKDLHLSRPGAHVRCLGKGSKERTLPLQEQAIQALEAYLEEGRPHLVPDGGG